MKIVKKNKNSAVVVAGETLAKIQQDAKLQDDFLDLCMDATVVLACRVSPK
jgi:hypothetical protein